MMAEYSGMPLNDSVPPLATVSVLLLPLLPTTTCDPEPTRVVQREFTPVTSTLLFEAVTKSPMTPYLTCTVPPLEMTRLFPLPPLPTARTDSLVKMELLPVTSTLLLEEVFVRPMTVVGADTLPPLEMTKLLPLPSEPT